ncbi:Protein transport protein USE1 [Nakaseomyces bracarensis]|uniref:Protein transport protein USE1 n=1 Tax=Nakaseomyces bracarensis TaxID=273131 RepID=A0ABR4NXU5_9SACH
MTDTLIDFLVSSKESRNIECRRQHAVVAGQTETYEAEYSAAAYEYDTKCHRLLKEMENEYKKYEAGLKTRRYSQDFDSAQEAEAIMDSANKEEESTSELRKRLLGRLHEDEGESGAHVSVEKQIQDHENIQQTLYEDMSKLVGSLKQGAVAFQEALEEDEKVLGAAEKGIQVASRGLVDISGKLKSYDKSKLGYIFYILTFFFMIIGLCITFIIIKLFPAL